MRAVGVREFGGPEALEVVELPEPHASTGHIRIRVHAAAVNPTDTITRSGGRAERLAAAGPPPYVPGMDAAGVVDEIGPDTFTDLVVGDRVMAIVVPTASDGAYAEYVVVPAESVVRAPVGSTHAEAATLPMNGLTAQLALDLLDLAPGSTLGVTGAAGAFGGYAVQLARAAGLRVVADASDADRELVAGLGADVVVARGAELAANVRAVAPDGVDGLADGAVQGDAVLGAVRDGGRIATVRGYEGPVERGISWHPVWVRDYARRREALDRLGRLAERGALTLRVAVTWSPEEASEAHRRLEAGGVRGRMVIHLA
ncbi:MAG: NADP-dependent oxidoreductase [Actinomycetota bacterium]